MNHTKILYTLFFLMSGFFVQAQDSLKPNFKIPYQDNNYGYRTFVEAVYQYGGFMQTNDKMGDLLEQTYTAFEYKVGFKTNGDEFWQKLYRYPAYGFGFYGANLDSAMGDPRAIFGFVSIPIVRKKVFHFDYDVGFGLAFHWNPYDSLYNPINFAIGAKKTVYVSVGLKTYYRLAQRFDASLGFEFRHFSNGATTKPNLGLNILNFDIGLRYNFNPIKNYTKVIDANYQPPIRPNYLEPEYPVHIPRNEINILFAPAFKEASTENYDSPKYFASTFAVEYMRKINLKRKLGVGIDFMYDASLVHQHPNEEKAFKNLFLLGIHGSFDLDVSRFSLFAALGTYLYNQNVDHLGYYYIRVGLKYNITRNDRLWAMIALKTQNGFIADWIEWGIGLRWHKYAEQKKKSK